MPRLKRQKSEETYKPPPIYASAAAPGVAAPALAPAKSTLTGPAPNTAGPHRHDFMNRLDPTVDSHAGQDRKLSRSERKKSQSQSQQGQQGQQSQQHQEHGQQGQQGQHQEGQSRQGQHQQGQQQQQRWRKGSGIMYPRGVGGPAPTTAGPHRHDFMNKLDPSVDSRPGELGSGRR